MSDIKGPSWLTRGALWRLRLNYCDLIAGGPVLYYEDLGPQVAHTASHFESFIKVDCF